MGAANARGRRTAPRLSNTPDGNVAELWAAIAELQDGQRSAREVFRPPLELQVDVVAGTEQRVVRLVNTVTGGVLTEWGPA